MASFDKVVKQGIVAMQRAALAAQLWVTCKEPQAVRAQWRTCLRTPWV
jgi:hypothetical protein